MQHEALRIAVVLPRGMSFAPERATSIDLCARDFTAGSAFRETTTLYIEEVEQPFEGFDLRMRPKNDLARLIAQLREDRPDLVIVHQHLPSVERIASRIGAPVLLHRHNFYRAERSWFSRQRFRSRTRKCAGVICVSDAVSEQIRSLAMSGMPVMTVPNALRMADWTPAERRANEIVFAGRAHPTKGVLELAQALRDLLPGHSDWRARLILSSFDGKCNYVDEVRRTIEPIGDRVVLEKDVPFERVKERLSCAAVAVMPTISREAFGRSAMEAMAGGAALASSLNGGLAEVVGDAAVPISPVRPDTIREALGALMGSNDLRADYARRGRRRALERFDIAPVCARLDGIYERFGRAR
ncbi:MAG: glycosyltransferase family 4 protein, partial [Rubricella sp.]